MSRQNDKSPERIWLDSDWLNVNSERHSAGNCFDAQNPEGGSVEYIRVDLVKANYFSEYLDAMHKIDALQRELDPDIDANTFSPAYR